MVLAGLLQTIRECSQGDAAKNTLRRLFPISQWLLNYKIGDLRYDIIAGVTLGLTIVPQCLAYAQMLNVSPLYGLYSSFIAQFVYALMGTSKDASIGPSAIVAMMIVPFNEANPRIRFGDNTYSCVMAFMSGIILVMIGVLKLGFIVNLFSIPVVSGFTCAAGFTIFASQLKTFFGLRSAPSSMPAVPLKQLINVIQQGDAIKPFDVAFGVSAVGFLLIVQYSANFIERFLLRRNSRLKTDDNKDPVSLTAQQKLFMEYFKLAAASRNVVVFIFSTLAAYLLISSDADYEKHITVVGFIPAGIPPPRFPALQVVDQLIDNETNETSFVVLKGSSEIFADITVSFVIVPLMIMLELFAITKALGRKNGYRIDATNELIAVGLGNFIQSFFQSFPVTCAVTRCALNDQCKVKTQLGSIISGIIVIIAVFALTGTFYYIPKASLAGIIMVAAYNLVDFNIVKPMWREYRRDVVIFFLTFLLCLFLDMAYGILICILVNMITFLRPVVRMAFVVSHERRGSVDKDGKHVDGSKTTIVKLSHGMKYPSADKFLDRMTRIITRSDQHVIIDCQFFTGIDYTGLQALRSILLLACQQQKHIIFTNMSEHLLKKVEKIGIDHWVYVDSVDKAVRHYESTHSFSGLRRVQSSFQVEIVHRSHSHHFEAKAESIDEASNATSEVGVSPQFDLGEGSVHMSPLQGEEMAKDFEWEQHQAEVIRALSSKHEAHFYGDIPIGLGNIHEGVADSSGSSTDDEQSSDDERSKPVQDVAVAQIANSRRNKKARRRRWNVMKFSARYRSKASKNETAASKSSPSSFANPAFKSGDDLPGIASHSYTSEC